MKLKNFYEKAVKAGIEVDLRGKIAVDALLTGRKKDYENLSAQEKEYFDSDTLFNPFDDTRILNGAHDAQINSIIVGIDVEGQEIMAVDALRKNGTPIDLALAHHPEGNAYPIFPNVMDLQIDAFFHHGLSISTAENLLAARRDQVLRRVHAANHQRSVDIARLFNVNMMCIHTPADNHAYDYMNTLIEKEKPKTMGRIMDLLYAIPEYQQAARQNNPPKITIGSKTARVNKVVIEFTGGTEGPQAVYDRLASQGIDTIIAMHQSEEHHEKCKAANINAIIASHIASDNLGVNLILDKIIAGEKIKVHEFSGFRRVARNTAA